ncbi:conserved protein of unknown function [Thermococcus nautili]|uniref:hypothetical protein n=1 Tax=Thermococcus nautili TaxID=195522 RepID=UPI00255211F1|nr:hypothetical protein [Thermococcus nautili]CAI1492697.1 conserved protein of unknown function [Thermococcus nautili]
MIKIRKSVYFLIFLSVFFIESIFWRNIVDGLIPAFLSILVIYFLDSKGKIKRPLLRFKEPYILGDSTKIEYLTQEELAERLERRKHG